MNRLGERAGALLDRAGRPLSVAGPVLTLAYAVVGLSTTVPGRLPAAAAIGLLLLTSSASLTLLLGPGLALCHLGLLPHRFGLGLAIVPGILLLAALGTLSWLIAARFPPHLTSALGTLLLALLLFGVACIPRRGHRFDRADRVGLLLIVLLLLFGAARGTWSVTATDDLYAGTISQTEEASNRPDSRISYLVIELVFHDVDPGSRRAEPLYFPYSFSSRGPISGLAAAPIVLTQNVVPPLGAPQEPWQPFDQQGFAAYRLAMETMAALAMLTVYSLARLLAGPRGGVLALLIAVTSPFIAHEVYFTWPKLLAGAFVLLAAHAVFLRRPIVAGVLLGVGYLVHPLALIMAPGLLLLWPLVVLRSPGDRKPLWIAAGSAGMLAAVLVFYLGWQRVNGPNSSQSSQFIPYLTAAGNEFPASDLSVWLRWRADSFLDTVVPFYVLFKHLHDPAFIPVRGPARLSVVFFLQYWTALPFAVGLTFAPLYAYGLLRALLRDWMLVTAVLIVPFAVFLVYWGSSETGLMREGLQPWLMGSIVGYAVARTRIRRWPVRLERVLLLTRLAEMLLLVLFPAIWSSRHLVEASFQVTDLLSVAAICLSCAGLAAATLLLDRPRPDAGNRRERQPGPSAKLPPVSSSTKRSGG